MILPIWKTLQAQRKPFPEEIISSYYKVIPILYLF